MDHELTAKWHELDKVRVGLKDVVVFRPDLRVADGYIQYSTDSGMTWTNLIAMAELKGADGSKGDPGIAGQDGHSPVVTATKSGKTTTISVDGTAIATVEDGADGAQGKDGAPGIYYGPTPPTGDTHPVWIDPDGGPDDGGLLPAVTADDNGKVLRVVSSAWAAEEIPTALPNPNALTFTGAVEGSYDGSAPLSVEIPSGGGSGSDISLGLTGAAVGQIAKITAVDASGTPTAWEPVDIPDGVPSVTASDNGKFLRVVSGAWAAIAINDANGVSF